MGVMTTPTRQSVKQMVDRAMRAFLAAYQA
jgi:hypothetical protein